MGNGLSLTQAGIKPVAGQAAFLPNQPIIHNCIVASDASAALVPGDVVTFASTALKGVIVIDKADNTDTPIGVIVGNAIKSSFAANEKASIFPVGSFVYLPAGAADLTLGAEVAINSSGQVVAASTNAVVGILWTQPSAIGDLVVVQISPKAAAST